MPNNKAISLEPATSVTVDTAEAAERVRGDIGTKQERVYSFLEREGLDALVLGRQDNLAWITAGGDCRVVTTNEIGAALVVITPRQKWLVAYWMDGRRLLEEEVGGQDFVPVNFFWHQGSLAEQVLELTCGMRVGADFPLPGARVCGPAILDLHYPLTDLDLERCRWVGDASNRILYSVACDLRPGVSEQEIAARLAYEHALAGITIDVLLVGTDERIHKYRHPLPSSKALERYALLHTAARRWGVHANVTRSMHFGRPSAEIQSAMDAVTRIVAEVITMLEPGVRFADILAEQKRLYESLGYAEEWNYHFQGGITGYVLADLNLCLNPEAAVRNRQAYDYFATVTGAKVEELALLTEDGVEIASMGAPWPSRCVETRTGIVQMPDVLIR